MGFFRKAKVKHRPQSDLIIGNTVCIDDTEKTRETSSKSNKSFQEVKIYETFSSRQGKREERRQEEGEVSVGEELDPRDHFDLFIPVKHKATNTGKGLLLPSGRSFSKRRSNADDASTVSSISCDSALFSDGQAHKQETKTISMRSIKSKKTRQS